MDPNNIASGFSTMLSNLKQQQSHWTTNFKLTNGASHTAIVEACRTAFLTQSLLEKKSTKEVTYTLSKYPADLLNYGEPIFQSLIEDVYLTATGVILYSETYATLCIFGDKSEVDDIEKKIDSMIKD